ncbi:polysaccharide biosynthesis/export family protein [Spirosoma fluviale]|uniref:Polysaccharide export outer membrane protein n=1 Tax=Spirosoma fluviale TaxID=1597977 RepID=A0A286FD55_9BACT|nr:polysaccharide biosynthesis/export family protein [Spirosoma fluviale]SOD81165.1 polysaccharide export outer membrane protein [Spirosoma fluviale]
MYKTLRVFGRLTVVLVFSAQLLSCVSTKPPKLEYFQSDNPQFPALIETVVPQVSYIKKGDILGIIVSTLNKESNEILNFSNVNTLPVSAFSGAGVGGGSQPLGFPVDSSGSVFMPIIGKQRVAGLTLEMAESKIKTVLEQTLKEPSVNIRFMNHKFSMLGEVNQVGTFNLLDDQTTILDALAACGDLTLYGKRDSVTVIRINNGMREIGRVNLRSREVFKSPYFYLQNGDIVYVEPTKDKEIPFRQLNPNLQRIPVYLGLFTSVISLIALFSRL